MRNCTQLEQQVARRHRIPDARNWRWWWRAQNVVNSDERTKLQAFTDWMGRHYAADFAALRRRQSMHLV